MSKQLVWDFGQEKNIAMSKRTPIIVLSYLFGWTSSPSTPIPWQVDPERLNNIDDEYFSLPLMYSFHENNMMHEQAEEKYAFVFHSDIFRPRNDLKDRSNNNFVTSRSKKCHDGIKRDKICFWCETWQKTWLIYLQSTASLRKLFHSNKKITVKISFIFKLSDAT